MPIVEHHDETRRPSLRRHVGSPVGGRRADEQERGSLDEGSRMLVEPPEHLLDHYRAGHTVQPA